MIPINYSCAGENTSPPLSWHGALPAGTKSWAIVMQDLDVIPAPWIQWMITGIPPETRTVPPGQTPTGANIHNASNGTAGFVGPCPPQGKIHRYSFTLFAIGGLPAIPTTATAAHALQTLKSAALATTTITGRYAR
jgi:Raf kinase inhibitor-like YbhB/YbcL family protein